MPLAEHDKTVEDIFNLCAVSIHVPLAEHDQIVLLACPGKLSFNSRAPRGARLYSLLSMMQSVPVSIHVPLAEHDGQLRKERRP